MVTATLASLVVALPGSAHGATVRGPDEPAELRQHNAGPPPMGVGAVTLRAGATVAMQVALGHVRDVSADNDEVGEGVPLGPSPTCYSDACAHVFSPLEPRRSRSRRKRRAMSASRFVPVRSSTPMIRTHTPLPAIHDGKGGISGIGSVLTAWCLSPQGRQPCRVQRTVPGPRSIRSTPTGATRLPAGGSCGAPRT